MSAALQPFGGGRVRRREADLYPTHPSGTEALLRAEGECLRSYGSVLEPACGPGMIVRVLQAHGFHVVGADLHDYGWGHVSGIDFTRAGYGHRYGCRALVTNPPYDDGLAEAFIRKAVVDLGFAFVAMLLKSTYFHADCRRALFETVRPTRAHPLGWRLDWSGEGSPPEEHTWFVWEGGPAAWCDYRASLPKPDCWPEVGWDEWLRRRAA